MSKLERAVEEALRRKKELADSEAQPAAVEVKAARAVNEAPPAVASPSVSSTITADLSEAVVPEAILKEDEPPVAATDSTVDGIDSDDDFVPSAIVAKPAQPLAASPGAAAKKESDTSHVHVLISNSSEFAASEVYGKIKSRLLRLAERAPELKRIMVTSTLKNEGKTLTAVNLAISFSRSYDQSVLLIDTDLRAPSVHRYLETRSSPGLIQCVTGEATLNEAIVETGIENLKVLPAGGTVANPVELLSSVNCQKLIKELSKTHKKTFIFFDAPPVLPFADAHALLPNMGGVIFVIREGFTRRDQFEEAIQNLDDASFVGIVFNGATRNTKWKAKDGYGYGYGYSY